MTKQTKKELIKNELDQFQKSSKALFFKASEVCKIADSIAFKESIDKFIKDVSSEHLYRLIHPSLPKFFRKSIYTKLKKKLKPDMKYKQIEELLECLNNHIKIQHALINAQKNAGYNILDVAPNEAFIVADLSSFLSATTVKKFRKVIDNSKKEQILSANAGNPTVYRADLATQRFAKKDDGSFAIQDVERIKTLHNHHFKGTFLKASLEYTNGVKASVDFKEDKIVISSTRVDGKTFKKEIELIPLITENLIEAVRITEQDIIEIIEFDIDENNQ